VVAGICACVTSPAPAPPPPPPPPASFAVGGTVGGLSGSGLSLLLNGANALAITANGPFTFGTTLAAATTYAVTVGTQPASPVQTCTVASGTGLITNANVTNVGVTCSTSSFTVGGTVSGLVGSGLVLHNNGADPLAIGANGPFTFAASVASGAPYVVTVATQPTGPTQACGVAGGSGTVVNANISGITVSCAAGAGWIGARQFGSTGADQTAALARHPAGGVYAAGNAAAAIADALGGGGSGFVARFDDAGTRLWIRQFDASLNGVTDVGVDAAGNAYLIASVVGAYPGQVPVGSTDAIVLKLDPAGAISWARQFGTAGLDVATGLAVDATGNVVAVGYTMVPGQDEGFVQRLTSTGALAGALEVIAAAVNPAQSSRDTRPMAVASDGSGYFVVGTTSGLLDAQPNAGSDDIFLRRYSPAGAHLGTHTFGSPDQDVASDIAISPTGRLHIAGAATGLMAGSSAAFGGTDGVLISVDRATGGSVTVRQFGSAVIGHDQAFSVGADATGDVYVVGETEQGFNGQATTVVMNAFVLRFGAGETLLWTRLFGGILFTQGFAAAADAGLGVFIGGLVSGTLPGNVRVGGSDAFVARFDANGVPQ